MDVQFGPNSVDEQSLLFKLQRKYKVFDTVNALSNCGYCLVASASKYGLVFIASPEGVLSVYYLKDLVNKDCDPQHLSVKLQENPTHIAVSCDHELLAITGGQVLWIYNIINFQNQNTSPSASIRCDVNPSTFVCALQWNPCIPDTIAIAFFDGTLIVSQVNTIQVKKIQSNARCICWSPKGKQLVVGNNDGTLCQYKPDLSPMKLVAAPNLFNGAPVEALAIYWIATYQFAVVYRNASDNSRPAVTIVNTPKAGQPSCLNYEDICYSQGSNRPWYYFLQGIAQWNLILSSSSNSMEIATLASNDGANWLQWCQTDEARPELPLTDKKQENYPVGVCIDTCAIHQLPWGENESLPHMPLLHVVSQTGLLTTFNIINMNKQAAQICAPPQQLVLPASLMIGSVPAVVTPPPSAPISAPIQTSTPVPQPIPALQPPLSAFQPAANSQVTSATFYGSYKTPFVQPLSGTLKTALITNNQPTDQKPQIEIKQAPQLQPQITTKPMVQLSVQQTTPQIKDVPPEQKVDLETIIRNKEIKLRSMLIKEVNDFQIELHNFMVKTRDMQIQHQNDLNSINADFNIQSLDPEKLKKECSLEELRSAVIQLKLELVRACAVVAEARTQSEAKELYQWSQADPLTTKRVTSVKKLAYYVQTQLEQAQKALDYKWNELATREPQFTKPGQRMIRPILDDVYQPLVKQQEILSRQQAVLRTLRNTLKECDATPMFKSTSLLRNTPFRNKDPLSKLTKNILNMSIETQTNNEKQPLLSHKKLDALKDMLSNHKTVKIKPVNMELRRHLTDMKLKYEKRIEEKLKLESNNQNVTIKTEPKMEPAVKIAEPKNVVKIEPKLEPKNKIKPKPFESKLEAVSQPTVSSFAPVPAPNNLNVKPSTTQNVVRTLFTDEPKKDQEIPSKVQLPPQIPQSNLAPKQQTQPIAPLSITVDTRNVLKDLLQNRTQASIENKNDDNIFMGQNICSPSAFNFAAPQQTTSTMPSILFAPKPMSDTTNAFGKIQTFTSEPKDKTTVQIKPKLETPIEAPQNKVVDIKPKVEKPITNLFALKPTTPMAQNLNVFKATKQEDIKVLAKTEEKTKEISNDKNEISKENIPKPSNNSFGATEPPNGIKKTAEVKFDNAKTNQKSESNASSIFASANLLSPTALKSQSIFGTSPQASSPTSIFGSPSKELESTSVSSNTVTNTTVSAASSLFAKAVASQPSSESGALPTNTTPEIATISTTAAESIVKTSSAVNTDTKQTVLTTPKSTAPVSIFGTTTTQSVFGSSVPQASVLETNTSSQSPTSAGSEATLDTQASVISISATTPQNLFKTANSPAQKETAFSTATASIFGTVTPTTQTSVFATPPSSQTSLFTSTTSTTQASVFGATTTQSTFGNQTTVFGTSSKTTQSSVFGTTSETTPASIFGAQTQTTQSSIFGSTTQATPTVFGAPQTGQASVFGTSASKNQVSAFGSPTPQVSIFGTAQTTKSTFFGSPTQTTQASIFGTPIQVSQTSVFGTPTPTTQAPVFGTPVTTTQTTSLFGGVESNIFAAASISATKPVSPTSGGNIFGGSSSGSVFGGSNSNVFGGKSTFGQTNPTTASIFGGGATFEQKQGTNLWGSGNASSGTGFGSGFAQQATTQASIFGGSSGGSFSAPSTGQTFGSPQPGPFSGGESTSSVFGSTQQSTSPTFGGSLAFGSQPVFGQSSSFGSPTVGGFSAFSSGFNKSPSSGGFGAPASFGGGATFGGSAFGSPSKVFGGSSPGFGAPTQSNSTFENLATQNTLTFGNLAQQSPQQTQQAAPTFNTYLTSGASVRNLSVSFRLGETTIRSIIKEVCKAIIDKMMGVFMPTPTAEDWEKIAEGFNDRWNFPNCIGAIDGKHINIIAPPNSGSLYYNYKKHFSIVLLAIVDDKYRFTVVDIGAYGKNSDGGIFASSKIGKRIQNNRFNIPNDKALPGTNVALPHVFVGDEAFPLQKNLLRPYPRSRDLSQDQKEFNNRLSRARKVVEDAFGILYQKFEIYNKNIRLCPDVVDNVVLTTCILHNVMRTYNIECNEQYCPSRRSAHQNLHREAFSDLHHIGGNSTAFDVRDSFAAYFKSSVGQLPWNT